MNLSSARGSRITLSRLPGCSVGRGGNPSIALKCSRVAPCRHLQPCCQSGVSGALTFWEGFPQCVTHTVMLHVGGEMRYFSKWVPEGTNLSCSRSNSFPAGSFWM